MAIAMRGGLLVLGLPALASANFEAGVTPKQFLAPSDNSKAQILNPPLAPWGYGKERDGSDLRAADEEEEEEEKEDIKTRSGWIHGLGQAFNPSCWGGKSFEPKSNCSEALPFFVGFISFVLVNITCSLHIIRRQVANCIRARRVANAGKEGKRKPHEGLVTSPNGHPLIRHKAKGGRAPCSNCGKMCEQVWGAREDNYSLCQTCYLGFVLEKMDGQAAGAELTKMLAGGADGDPVTIEVLLTMETLVEKEDKIHEWFDQEIQAKARKAGIKEDMIAKLDQNVQVIDVLGGVYGSYAEFADKIEPGKFPIRFKFSTHPIPPPNQAANANAAATANQVAAALNTAGYGAGAGAMARSELVRRISLSAQKK